MSNRAALSGFGFFSYSASRIAWSSGLEIHLVKALARVDGDNLPRPSSLLFGETIGIHSADIRDT